MPAGKDPLTLTAGEIINRGIFRLFLAARIFLNIRVSIFPHCFCGLNFRNTIVQASPDSTCTSRETIFKSN